MPKDATLLKFTYFHFLTFRLNVSIVIEACPNPPRNRQRNHRVQQMPKLFPFIDFMCGKLFCIFSSLESFQRARGTTKTNKQTSTASRSNQFACSSKKNDFTYTILFRLLFTSFFAFCNHFGSSCKVIYNAICASLLCYYAQRA